MPQACRCSRGTWTVPLIKCLSFCSCLECQALGPGDHCRFLTAELFCSFCLFLFLSEDFLFPAAATPHCSQRGCRFLSAVWVLCTAWPSQWSRNHLAHSSVSLTAVLHLYSFCFRSNPGHCFCITLRIQIHAMIYQPPRARALLFSWLSETWKIFIYIYPCPLLAVCTCFLIAASDNYIIF